MARFLARAGAAFLLLTGAFLFWQGRAEQPAPLAPPPPPATRPLAPISLAPVARHLPPPPEASPRTREEKRFGRADKDDDGRITAAELYEPRRKAFAKLDRNGDGTLSFDEWAVRTIDKFKGADQDRSAWLSPAEFATTAPKPRKQPACSC